MNVRENVPAKNLVLDANILIRAVLGPNVRRKIQLFAKETAFVVPDIAHWESQRHVSALALKRGEDPEQALILLTAQIDLCDVVGPKTYRGFESEAATRLRHRDPDDWPILATALSIGCPIWTEDYDFFGCGVATWTSDRVEIYLRNEPRP